MEVNSASSIYYNPQDKLQPAKKELDKDAFLQILVAQLRYQNPMSPMDQDQFMTQMTQITALEQIMNLNKNMEVLLRTQELSLTANLVGKQVTAVGEDGRDVEGTVEKLIINENGIKLVINGTPYDYDRVKEIRS
ncbi:flagellar hook capping FlgD N-terminal domain-containing protein [Desulfofundulus thermosubterraneus]|uniref:Flagellar basal-body rod modification protein FlgD n=1 Tax=Desulfofundulus thermosubterraneus DSM 16057 TaxID=1121432 RepID=A0A1M6FWW4_9FIRM|nr:flagellar hook capping FlgD N-terminal domain-containing protein [Desulfofundulus thermosubterraneus]SHJ02208.1 flagellar basal-body rod modification protein FlgD [Desulfofundulus thermosubterraneus DSM 16057]